MEKAERQLKKALRLSKMPRYKRLGECNMCGDCCETEGPDGGPCEYFERESPDKGICTVFGKPERYERCPLFPELPPICYERCSYYFQDRYEGGKLIRAGEPV